MSAQGRGFPKLVVAARESAVLIIARQEMSGEKSFHDICDYNVVSKVQC